MLDGARFYLPPGTPPFLFHSEVALRLLLQSRSCHFRASWGFRSEMRNQAQGGDGRGHPDSVKSVKMDSEEGALSLEA